MESTDAICLLRTAVFTHKEPCWTGLFKHTFYESRGNQPLVQPCCPCLVTHTRLFVSGLVLFAAPRGGLAKGRPPPGLFSTRP